MTTIAVMAHDRPDALRRLLGSLPDRGDVPLIVSIDGDGAALRDVTLPPRAQRVIRGERLGLKEHFFRCGDLTREHDSLIILEDDLYVSPALVPYAEETLARYGDDASIAGVSLYAFCFNECAETPFAAIDDGHDVYFAQSAGWGLAFTAAQWSRFRTWLEGHRDVRASPLLPHEMNRWPEPTWKRLFNLYLAEERLYLVTPRIGVATNLAEPGVHVGRAVTYLSSPLAAAWRQWRMPLLRDSLCRYDPFLQLEPESLRAWSRVELPESLAVDLYGQRDRGAVTAEWLVTACRRRAAERTFGLRLFPFEANVLDDLPGNTIALARAEDVGATPTDDVLYRMRSFFRPHWH